ncbi:MAG: chorismate mutase [Chloroflexi bacterium]|nr:MAG: chorismate mutase [Chloroflexota bacterium]MBL1193451.1 chorismate mutase [Chloroflexota bacterium]NOH10742.1 chorismate mutase [Chloroflexota bacterium]
MTIRGVRGAISVLENTPEDIYAATQDLLAEIVGANSGLEPEDIASILFTTTPDLNAAFPATTARTIPGWEYVPLLCSQEIMVPGSMQSLIRVLLHWNTDLPQKEVQHVYLGDAAQLRPDLNHTLEKRHA